MALCIIGLILGVLGFAAVIYFLVKEIKSNKTDTLSKKIKLILNILVLAAGCFTIASTYGFMYAGGWNFSWAEHLEAHFGSYFFGTGFLILFSSFVLYYYKPDLNEKTKKYLRIAMFSVIFFVIFGLLLILNAFGPYVNATVALPNCLSFTQGFVQNNTNVPGGVSNVGFSIPFYGTCIVGGAVMVFFICDHYFYRKFKRHGILDTLLLVAFPAGLIGARLWYCLILEPATYLKDPIKILYIWDGGLGIMGGAILGIAAGVLFMWRRRRYVNIRWAMDVIVPTILLAQAVGRFGNFFNCEVHGNAVDGAAWSWLPSIIYNNMQYSSTGASLVGTGQIYVPLFLIEACMNISMYFVIRYAIGKPLRKWLSLGDLACMYISWYGLCRVILEPLRYGSYEYGQSWITAWIMFGAGFVGILIFHLYDLFRKKKGLPPRRYDTI